MTVFVVDDEPLQRESLSQLIQELRPAWEVLQAIDGAQVMEQIDSRVDIVFADIRMPRMDGLELAERIQRDFPRIQVVFVSAHDEFEYAQTAICLGVRHYLLKPVLADDLTTLLEQLEGFVAIQRREWDDKEKYRKGRDNRASGFLVAGWLRERLNPEELASLHTGLSLPASGRIGVFVFRSDEIDITWLNDDFIDEVLEYLRDTILLPGFGIYRSSPYRPELTFLLGGELTGEELHSMFHDIVEKLYRDTMLCIRVGIGSCRDDLLLGGPISFREARIAAEQYFYCPEETVFLYEWDAGSLHNNRLPEFGNRLSSLENTMLEGDAAAAVQVSDEILDLLLEARLPAQVVRDEIAFTCKHALYQVRNALTADMYHELVCSADAVKEGDLSAAELRGHSRNLVEKAVTLLSREENDAPLLLVHITEIFRSMPLPEITLTTVADRLKYSAPYLSKLFKERYGISFSEYVGDYRMSQAKELLSAGRHKVQEISAMVGFQDARYFSRLFKKKYGVTPDDFRHRA